jgi:hypothetical protein
MTWVIVEADDQHSRMMITRGHDEVMQVFEVLGITC